MTEKVVSAIAVTLIIGGIICGAAACIGKEEDIFRQHCTAQGGRASFVQGYRTETGYCLKDGRVIDIQSM